MAVKLNMQQRSAAHRQQGPARHQRIIFVALITILAFSVLTNLALLHLHTSSSVEGRSLQPIHKHDTEPAMPLKAALSQLVDASGLFVSILIIQMFYSFAHTLLLACPGAGLTAMLLLDPAMLLARRVIRWLTLLSFLALAVGAAIGVPSAATYGYLYLAVLTLLSAWSIVQDPGAFRACVFWSRLGSAFSRLCFDTCLHVLKAHAKPDAGAEPSDRSSARSRFAQSIFDAAEQLGGIYLKAAHAARSWPSLHHAHFASDAASEATADEIRRLASAECGCNADMLLYELSASPVSRGMWGPVFTARSRTEEKILLKAVTEEAATFHTDALQLRVACIFLSARHTRQVTELLDAAAAERAIDERAAAACEVLAGSENADGAPRLLVLKPHAKLQLSWEAAARATDLSAHKQEPKPPLTAVVVQRSPIRLPLGGGLRERSCNERSREAEVAAVADKIAASARTPKGKENAALLSGSQKEWMHAFGRDAAKVTPKGSLGVNCAKSAQA